MPCLFFLCAFFTFISLDWIGLDWIGRTGFGLTNIIIKIMNGIGSTSSRFPSSTNGETWGESSNSLYTTRSPVGASTTENSPNNSSKQPFHLPNHFDFDQLKSSNDVNVGSSDPIKRIGAESIPSGLGLFTSDTTNGTNNASNGFHEKTFDVMQIGSRRPASTGVIGHNHKSSTSSSVMESLGLISPDHNHSYSQDTNNDVAGSAAAIAVTTSAMAKRKQQKPIMDLIQEDFEKPPSPEYPREDRLSGTGGASVVTAGRSADTGSNTTNVHTSKNTPVASSTTPSSMKYNLHNNSSAVNGTSSSLPVGSPHSSSSHLNFVTGITNNFEDNVSLIKEKRRMLIQHLFL